MKEGLLFFLRQQELINNNCRTSYVLTSLPSFSLHLRLLDLDGVQSANPVESRLDVKLYIIMQETADQK